jgi:hypothetical protein
MARWKALIVLIAAVATVASAPAQDTKAVAKKAVAPAMESDEQIVSDFLHRKERAEHAQRAIIYKLRHHLDQKRAEFESAKKSFDDARGVYETILGPLPKQGVMNPSDPRLPYEFDVRRLGLDSQESRLGNLSQGGGEPTHK